MYLFDVNLHVTSGAQCLLLSERKVCSLVHKNIQDISQME